MVCAMRVMETGKSGRGKTYVIAMDGAVYFVLQLRTRLTVGRAIRRRWYVIGENLSLEQAREKFGDALKSDVPLDVNYRFVSID